VQHPSSSRRNGDEQGDEGSGKRVRFMVWIGSGMIGAALRVCQGR